MTKSPITWVKTFGFTMALGSPFSFLLLLLSKLLLGDEAALHVVGTVIDVVVPFVTVLPLVPMPVPPMQLSLISATDVDVVVNVELLVDVVNDDMLSSFTAVVDGVVVVVVSMEFRSFFDASSPDGTKM